MRLVTLVGWLLALGALSGCNNVELSCNTAVAQYERLRADTLRKDPALAAHPELAAEHLRQTSDLSDAPVRARCAADPQLPRCIAQSATFVDAQRCL